MTLNMKRETVSRRSTRMAVLQGHHVRLAISGVDPKHFHVDHKGKRTMWIHTGPDKASCLQLPCKPLH